MTPRQIELIQKSFANVTPLGADAGRIFYGRLFNIAPDVRRLFRGDLEEQSNKLMDMLAVIVADLNNLDALIPTARDIAKRHVDYGVEPQHYAPVGEALIWTLANTLGDTFDDETAYAWREAYAFLSEQMLDAAYSGEVVQ